MNGVTDAELGMALPFPGNREDAVVSTQESFEASAALLEELLHLS